ncbi:ABC transporter permease [Streptomyces sp. NPDC002896]|uniref:ABC transporter permease n=1 Tax=Streptomyces sp. NPDC002896 TaxID=3154438 RepID=UPI003322A57D
MTTPHPQQANQQAYAPAPQAPHGAPAANWQGAPGGSYTSPIPVTRTHLGHAIGSEWTKIKSVRSTMWTLGVFLCLVIGIGLLVAAQTNDADYVNVPFTLPAFFGLVLGQICLITLGVLVISSEYGTGMIRTTFTASPQRHRVLTAKVLIYFAVAFVTSAVAIGLVGLATSAMHSGPEATGTEWVGTVFKGALYVSLLGVLALAVGSMLRHSAGAITAMLGLVLVPAILPAFLMISESTRKIGETMLDYNAPNSLAKIFQLDSEGGHGSPQLWLLVGLTAAALAGAFALLEKRDV